MLQLKLCENRIVCSTQKNKPIIVKALTKLIHRHDNEQYLRVHEVDSAINGHEWLSEKTVD